MTKEPKYTRSNGQTVLLTAMETPHLRSAYFKLLREDPEHPELADMALEVRARAVKWQAELQAERVDADPARVAEIDTLLAKVAEELGEEA